MLVAGVVQRFLLADNFFVPLLFTRKTTGLWLPQEQHFHREGKLGSCCSLGVGEPLSPYNGCVCDSLSSISRSLVDFRILKLGREIIFSSINLPFNLLMKNDGLLGCFQSCTGTKYA